MIILYQNEGTSVSNHETFNFR